MLHRRWFRRLSPLDTPPFGSPKSVLLLKRRPQSTHVSVEVEVPDYDFDESIRIAEAEYNRHHPDVIVGSYRGGAVAVNMQSGYTPLVLMCPAWRN